MPKFFVTIRKVSYEGATVVADDIESVYAWLAHERKHGDQVEAPLETEWISDDDWEYSQVEEVEETQNRYSGTIVEGRLKWDSEEASR